MSGEGPGSHYLDGAFGGKSRSGKVRIRTITAGLTLGARPNLTKIAETGALLRQVRSQFTALGYEVQTLRIATEPYFEWQDKSSSTLIDDLAGLAEELDITLGIGPIIGGDSYDSGLANWAVDLVQRTERLYFSAIIASPEQGIHHKSLQTSAEIIQALAGAKLGGMGNFNFAALAHIGPGTPFFPAAYHQGPDGFALGLETPPLLTQVFAEADSMAAASGNLKARMNQELGEVERLAQKIAGQTGLVYGGIDTSPAPGPDASIGQAIETLTEAHRPFRPVP